MQRCGQYVHGIIMVKWCYPAATGDPVGGAFRALPQTVEQIEVEETKYA
jgi:hypothetical protein